MSTWDSLSAIELSALGATIAAEREKRAALLSSRHAVVLLAAGFIQAVNVRGTVQHVATAAGLEAWEEYQATMKRPS